MYLWEIFASFAHNTTNIVHKIHKLHELSTICRMFVDSTSNSVKDSFSFLLRLNGTAVKRLCVSFSMQATTTVVQQQPLASTIIFRDVPVTLPDGVRFYVFFKQKILKFSKSLSSDRF